MGRLYLFMAKTAWKKTLKLNEKCLPLKDFIIGEFTRGGEGGASYATTTDSRSHGIRRSWPHTSLGLGL